MDIDGSCGSRDLQQVVFQFFDRKDLRFGDPDRGIRIKLAADLAEVFQEFSLVYIDPVSVPRISILDHQHLSVCALFHADAGLTYLGGGKLLLMWFNHPREFYYDRDKKTEHTPDLFTAGAYEAWNSLSDEDHIYGSFVKLSTDYGKTWGETYKIPLTAPHGAILLSNGNIMMLGIPFHTSGISSSVYAAVSKDEGKSWEILAKIPDTVGTEKIEYCEAHLAELNDGTLVGAIRYQENDRSQYFTVYTTFSYDGGHTWTPAAPTGICGSPPHLLKLASGELLLTYARRIAPYGQFARISHDGGKTWGDEITLDDNAPDWDEGYPSTAQLDDGSLITVYYQKWADDSYCSILYTKWELPKQ